MKESQVRYQKSMEHHYLVVSQEGQLREDYQLRMVLENRIAGLLSLEVKQREGRKELYYDVSSLQPLTRIYDRRELSGEEIRRIFTGILDALGGLHEYMLEEGNVVLDPEYIFTDPEEGKIHLLFLPGSGTEEGDDPLLQPAEFLMEHADHRDPQAAMCAYRIYQTIRKGNYVTKDLRKALEGEATGSGAVTERIPKVSVDPEKEWFAEPADLRRENERMPLSEEDLFGRSEAELHPQSENRGNAGGGSGKAACIAAAGLILVGILVCSGAIPGVYPDKAGKLVAFAFILAGAAVILLQHRKAKKGGNMTEADPLEAAFADMAPRELSSREFPARELPMAVPVRAAEKEAEENYGKTVFVGAVDVPVENVLVEAGKKKEYRIGHFPYTIGKRKECVDLALTDRTVSRIHARILWKDGHAYLQDCHSTNGTYLNGVQLEAEETVMLEREDEICIGKVKFSYL